MAMAPSPRTSTLPAAQVRQYSWRHYDKNDVSDIRRESVGTNKRINHVSPFLFQQAPLVSRVHLLKVVERIGKRERSKGKHLTDYMFKKSYLSDGKDMTSLLFPGQKADERNKQYSVMCKGNNSSEISLCDHKYQQINDNCTLKDSEADEKGQEAKFKPPGSTNYDIINDAALNGDVTRPDVNKAIARTCYAQKHSFVSKIGYIKSSLSVYSRTFTRIILLLAIIISVIGGLFNIRLSGRKSTVGNSSSLFLSEPISTISFRDALFLSIFRELSAPIISINEQLCSCFSKGTFLNNKKNANKAYGSIT